MYTDNKRPGKGDRRPRVTARRLLNIYKRVTPAGREKRNRLDRQISSHVYSMTSFTVRRSSYRKTVNFFKRGFFLVFNKLISKDIDVNLIIFALFHAFILYRILIFEINIFNFKNVFE